MRFRRRGCLQSPVVARRATHVPQVTETTTPKCKGRGHSTTAWSPHLISHIQPEPGETVTPTHKSKATAHLLAACYHQPRHIQPPHDPCKPPTLHPNLHVVAQQLLQPSLPHQHRCQGPSHNGWTCTLCHTGCCAARQTAQQACGTCTGAVVAGAQCCSECVLHGAAYRVRPRGKAGGGRAWLTAAEGVPGVLNADASTVAAGQHSTLQKQGQ